MTSAVLYTNSDRRMSRKLSLHSVFGFIFPAVVERLNDSISLINLGSVPPFFCTVCNFSSGIRLPPSVLSEIDLGRGVDCAPRYGQQPQRQPFTGRRHILRVAFPSLVAASLFHHLL